MWRHNFILLLLAASLAACSEPDMRGDMPVQRIHRTLTTSAPEQRVAAESDRGRNAVRATGESGHQVAEQERIRIEDAGHFVIIPKRIKFREIGHIEHLLFETRAIYDGLEQYQYRVNVPMHLIERTGVGVVLLFLRAVRRVEAGVHINAAQRGHAERLSHHIDVTHWLPKTDLDTWIDAANTDRRATRIRGVLLPEREGQRQRARTEIDREYTTPADVGNQVGETPLAIERGQRILPR